MTLAVMISIAILAYVYLIYPGMLKVIASLKSEASKRIGTSPYKPLVSLIIPAYNEHAVIRQKLENSLSIYYPKGLLEIVVASDGSVDGTNEIVEEYDSRGVVLRAFSPRAGKISALNKSIPLARGEIVVLCDANVMFHPDAIELMVTHFADPNVGAVTGDVRIRSEEAPFGEGEGFYYKYERFIQLQESALGSTVTVDGGMYAIRRNLFRQLPPDTILDDFVIGMNVALSGHRVIYDPSVVASENATLDVRQEFRRKVRIVAGAFRELLRGHGVPGPKHGQLFWSYVSHKLLRWLVPWYLLVIFCCSIILAWRDPLNPMSAVLMLPQVLFYGCALLGSTRPNAHWPGIIGIPFYFCMVNTAAWFGFLRGILRLEQVTWRKADR
jgi:biofilm PGA synthesis N-glycosyltransferase PgaC